MGVWFHGITFPWIFAAIQQGSYFLIMFCFGSAKLKRKSLLKVLTSAMFCSLYIKQKFSMVKLIPWNLVDLSHLYYYHIWTESFYLHWKDMMSTFVEVIRREMMNEKKERKVVWAFTEDSTTVKVKETHEIFCFVSTLGSLALHLHKGKWARLKYQGADKTKGSKNSFSKGKVNSNGQFEQFARLEKGVFFLFKIEYRGFVEFLTQVCKIS